MTLSSTSSGAAPRYVVVISIWLSSIPGIPSLGIFLKEINPNKNSPRTNTLTAILLLRKYLIGDIIFPVSNCT